MSKAERLMYEQRAFRDLIYGDGHYCERVRNCKYDRYLLDNKENEKVLDELFNSRGIKLVVAPTGSGKSHSLIERAKVMLQNDKDAKVFFTLPTRTLTLQVGNKDGVSRMVGGDTLDKGSQLIASTYEKMFEVDDYGKMQSLLGNSEKFHLVLDECHLLTTQLLFREKAIKSLISYIQEGLFENVLLVSATPEPASLFRFDEVVEFSPTDSTPAIDKVEIVQVDDISEYIKGLDYSKEFPFIRWNNKEKIDRLIKDMPQRMVRITRDDKNTKAYADIVNNSKIDTNGDSVLVTNILECGVNVTDYPDNIVPMSVFDNANISTLDIVQFLNRLRRTDKNHVKTARVVLQKTRERELRATLINKEGDTICEFSDIALKLGHFYVNDTDKLDAVSDGEYKIRLEVGGTTVDRKFRVASEGPTDESNGTRYSKEDPMPLIFYNVSFRPMPDIFKANKSRIDRFSETLQQYVDVFEKQRLKRKQQEALSDDEMDALVVADEVLIEKMAMAAISEIGELEPCLSYENGEILVDYRVLYMISYNQFQRQYYYNHELLRRELEWELGTSVVILDEETAKGVHKKSNPDDIWEDIEDLRQEIVHWCSDDYWDSIMGKSHTFMNIKSYRETVYQIRGQELLMELLKELQKAGIEGELALRILTSSKIKRKVNQYKKLCNLITNNQALDKLKEYDVNEIPLLNKKVKDKSQLAIFCYLKQRGQDTYKITAELVEEIVEFYKEAFPMSRDIPSARSIRLKLREMYQTKGADKIRKDLRKQREDIFKLVESDF